ncbi:D-glycero-beta-D-manno-heptose-7-phosphate kinase [Pelistega sp. NLN82]|uniref:D-glycero-beta-D-manno-heptose-7-phosphate kinase n=1 Tax=Pelistega ratti TaxID=2652177 RepID=A0A6L9Y5U5_9BURK|nr:D-glycero-beta-D-manno-heptose-7-phosphate kinase [Pelistega ratti]NEN75872.1 D-glycero-beta-D-manno-heptose-7-phosphate kinase [Pelistega ratti]
MHFPIETIKTKKILVIGDLMLDRYWFGEVDRISPEAPVPVVHVARKEDRLGGACNVARNIRALGAQATLLGIIGNDEAGQKIQALCHEADIVPHLEIDAHIDTTLKMRVLGRQQQLLRVDFEQKPRMDTLERLNHQVRACIDHHDVLVLSDYNKGVLTQVQGMIAYAREKGIPILVDPKGNDYQKYRGASLVTPNRTEMMQAVGAWHTEDELTQKANKLRDDLHLDALLVTRSEQGMTLFAKDGRFHEDAQAHEVYDVSGAGDTVLATLAVTRATDMSWEQAIGWANKAGGIVVGKLGTSIVTAEELI